MLDGSMSACAEANGVKVGDVTNSASLAITNNFNMPAVDSAKPSFIAKAISSVRGALDPVGCARESAEARKVKAESDIEVYGLYRQNMPWLSERQAFLYANGFVTTPTQADNVFAVFDAAESKVEGFDEVIALPAPVVERVVNGAKDAYDDDAREMWASVLAGELDRPGSISKRTMSVLSDMEKAHAEAFLKLCECTVEVEHDGTCELLPLMDGPFSDYSLTKEEADLLDEVGLTHIHDKGMVVFRDLPFSSDGTALVTVNGSIFRVTKNEENDPAMGFPELTTAGKELAAVCGIGSAAGLEQALLEAFVRTRKLR